MVIDIEIRYSGGACNATGLGSLGGVMSSTEITTDQLQNLFDNISRQESLLGKTEYRAFYVYNNGACDAVDARIEFTGIPGVTDISLGLDPIGRGNGTTTGVATTIATECTTPTGVGFFDRTNEWSKTVLPLGFLKAGTGVGIWLKRVTETSSAQTLSITMKIEWNPHSVTPPAIDDVTDNPVIGEAFKVTKLVTPFVIGTAKIGQSQIT